MTDIRRFAIYPVPPLGLRDEDGPIAISSIRWEERKIKPSHSRHLTGRHPLGKGRGSVPFESGLERDVIGWLISYPGLVDLKSQPVTVEAWAGNTKLKYTPDLLIEFDPPPPALLELGFASQTFIEVKPHRYCNDARLWLKLNMLKAALGVPALLLTEIE